MKVTIAIPPRDGFRFTGEAVRTAPGAPVIAGDLQIGEIEAAWLGEDGWLNLDLTCECERISVNVNTSGSVSMVKEIPELRLP